MKPAVAGVILLVVWVVVMLLWGSSEGTQADVRNYDRNQALENPCDFMSSGQYSVNC